MNQAQQVQRQSVLIIAPACLIFTFRSMVRSTIGLLTGISDSTNLAVMASPEDALKLNPQMFDRPPIPFQLWDDWQVEQV